MLVPWTPEKFYSNDSVSKYNSIIEKVCREYNLPFIPMFDLLEKNELDDGLHPNSIGHEKMFLRIKDFLLGNNIIH